MIDLTNAYFLVAICLKHQHHLHFAVSLTVACQFVALSFNLSSAPRVFMMILREVAQFCIIMESCSTTTWLICHYYSVILQEHLKFALNLA